MTRLHTLSNGVRVICDPVPGLETVALSVVAGRGARHEDASQSGWSHLLEHMVFKGAGNRSAREIVESIEGQGGHINAATGYERTSFQVRALAGGLDLGSAVLADLILRPRMDPDDLVREKQVVGQEIAEAVDTPDDQVFEMAQSAAYEGQPLGRSILGTDQSIAPATPEGLQAWRAQLYAPDKLIFAASGAVDEDEVLALAERDFGSLDPVRTSDYHPAYFTGGDRSESKSLEQANLVFMLPTIGVADPDYFALRLYAEILGGGMSSRLFQEAREKLGLAYAVDAFAETYADQGVLGVFAGCAAKDAARLAEVAAQQILSLAQNVTVAELSRAKAQLKAGLFMARESPLARAEQAAGQVLLFDRLLTTVEIAEDVDRVTATDLHRVGSGLTVPGKVVTSILGPKSAHKAAEAFRSAIFAS